MEVKLDEHQLKAVKHFEGPALVVAGPGSGKTTVIIERILNLIHEHNVDPAQILAIAFTNAAVDEMKTRLSCEAALPKICTLHVFGKELITDHYDLLGFSKEPETWGAEDIREKIYEERYWLKRATDTTRVAIYKMEGKRTHRCYIGQTTDPERRKQEHRTYSSNRGLREALQRGNEEFEFEIIRKPMGKNADYEETEEINNHRNRAAVILEEVREEIVNENPDIGITLYKIKSKSTVTCYFGLSTDLEQSKELHFTESPNDSFREAIENEEIDISSFEVMAEGMSWVDASTHLEGEVRSYKKWAVFNDEDPLHARDSTRRRIEVFCKYFNVPYDEVLEHTQKFEHEMQKFDNLIDDIEKQKRQVKSGKFQPHKIVDPILRAFATRYEERKDEANAIDLFDMLICSADMLEEKPELLDGYREKYRYVFVDEFQDISPTDFRLIKLFPDNLFAVGDDDQAIYGFRGGDSNIMQKDFGNWENVEKYEVTCNYRSTSSIVMHAKALIKHNKARISKDLRAEKFSLNQVKILNSTQKNVKEALLSEISNILSSNYQNFGILARNWKGEINAIQKILDCDEIKKQGFDIEWEGFEDSSEDFENEDEEKRRKMYLRHGSKEIEIINIHKAKGREWDKVILLVNTMYNSFPDDRNDLAEERRLFYVAVTRAKHELLILDAGKCQFTSEFQDIPLSEHKQQLKKAQSVLLSAFGKRLTDAKEQLTDAEEQLQIASEILPTALMSQRERLIESSAKAIRKQYKIELEHRRNAINRTESTTKKIKTNLPQQLKKSEENFLPKLIPVLDQLESVIKNVTETIETNILSDELATFCEDILSTQEQFLDLLKNYGIKPFETIGTSLNLQLHEVIQPALYSDKVPQGKIVKEFQRGYLLHDQVIQKAKVAISKGPNPWTTERLEQVVEIYLDRLISAFQTKYQFTNFEKPRVIEKMVKYLLELEDESIKEIGLFSSKSTAEAIEVKRYADYCAGPEKIHLCTSVFQDFWNKMWEIIISDIEKDNKQADVLLSQDFTQPVRFITYSGIRDLTNIKTFQDHIVGIDTQGSKVNLETHTILFAFPKENMDVLKPNVKTRRAITDQKLQPVQNMSERFHVADDSFKTILINQDTGEICNQKSGVQLVTRSGHVLKGYLWDFNFNFLFMQINGTDVVVYRHGLLEFKYLDWDEIVNAYKSGIPIYGKVSEEIKGGLKIKYGSLYGFLPASEIELRSTYKLDSYIGKAFEMKIIKLNKQRKNFVLSRRAWLKEKRNEFFKTLKIGQQVTGIVKNITTFGAFVDLGYVDGLIHITELALKRIGHPSEVISIGDEVEVKVIKFNREDGKIWLSLKQMKSAP
ncbi:MAG: nucleotide exchange factor GrpE [Candidatus Poribacteria bacterium]|nr:nucleotide exchange factor GrpE [Candidatus Poribacteria bacterium]